MKKTTPPIPSGIKGNLGRFFVRDGAAFAEAMDNGCFGQCVPVKPGECYAVSVRVRKTGPGDLAQFDDVRLVRIRE